MYIIKLCCREDMNDLIQKRTVIRTYACSNVHCSNHYTNTSTETRRVHQH